MKRIARTNKKWKWMVLLTSVFLIAFMAVHSFRNKDDTRAADVYLQNSDGQQIGGTYTMRRHNDTFSMAPAGHGVGYIKASLSNDRNMAITNPGATNNGTVFEGAASALQVEAKDMGELSLSISAYATNPTSDTKPLFEATIQITVAFSVNEYLNDNAKGAYIRKIFLENERSAIILDPEAELPFGKNASVPEEQKYLNLIFGNASQDTTNTTSSAIQADWVSGNEDIIEVDRMMTAKDKDGNETVRGGIRAVGAGRTTLSVSWRDDTTTRQDTIEVYVRPKITDSGGQNIGTNSSGIDDGTGTGTPDSLYQVNNGDIIKVSVQFEHNQLDAISDKLAWVIAKKEGTKTFLVRDSLGNVTDDFKDEANLVWMPSINSYRLNAKAGTYSVLFYVAGTYRGFESARTTVPGCAPVAIKNGVYVYSNYKNITISLNVGGTYSLPDAFNITDDTFMDCFVPVPRVVEDAPSPSGDDEGEPATDSAISAGNSNNFISLSSDMTTVTATRVGTAYIDVTANSKILETGLREIKEGQRVTITINITDTFSLNISQTRMSVGEELQLYGVLGSGTENEEAEYEWVSPDDPNGSFVKIAEQGRYATIKAVKTTPAGGHVTVTLRRTTSNGITLTASCQIIIDITTSGFHIKPSALTMEVGDVQTITTDLTGSYRLTWISSDTGIATVVDSSAATPSAQVTARKPGTAVITAVNAANNVYATCIITVQQPITSLDIGVAKKKYTTYDATLPQGFVFMEALYQPSNATEKDFKWDSSDKTVATVDETGKVTLLKEGSTYISVASSKYTAFCILNIISKPISTITVDPKELSMVRGDSHTIKATFNPVDATNTSLVWTSLDEKVAKVDATGKVTATGPGSTYINVEAALADSDGNKAKNIIKVTVRDRLTSIDFESRTTYINVGGSKQIEIIYKPDKDVNKKVTFTSSDDSIFRVTPGSTDGTCVIQGIAEGQAVLSCISEDLGQAGVKTCTVHVTASTIEAKDFVLTPAAETVYIGATLQLVKTFTPNNATNQNVTWSSSDSGIASVTSLGLVRGVKEGKVTVSAVYTDTKNKVPLIRTSTIEVKPVPINVTDFDVTPDTQNIKVGDKFSLTPVFTPNNASNKNVEYQSLDEGVVKVSEKGEVTGIGAGDAIIQCQAEDGGFIATCMVHVDNAIEFSLSPSSREIAVGKTFKLKKVTKPENAKKTAEWSTSNSSIATVDASGKVTAKRIGSCTITCTLTKYNQTARCKVKVAKLKSSVSIDKKNIRIGVGQTYRLKKTVKSNNTSLPKVTWKSANKRVATVSSGGKITGKKVGLTKITVTTNDAVRAKATCKVRVIQRISSISLNSDYMVCYVGRSKKLTARCKPSNATIKKVKWTSGDESIARVTGTGKVRAISEGNTYITATATDGSNRKARCFVKVLDAVPATSIVVAQSDLTLQRGDSRKLTYKVLPDNTSDGLEFASNNERVARVNNKGRVTAVGTGDAVITILATSGASSTVNVNVVALNKTELVMRQYDTETLIMLGTADNVTWYTSNARIATVENGKITGRSEGTTYIYAYVNGCRLSCRVTITSVNE
ncbi:MAG: Ig-like domain-containing protein [Lachnospiraceae bacterium]